MLNILLYNFILSNLSVIRYCLHRFCRILPKCYKFYSQEHTIHGNYGNNICQDLGILARSFRSILGKIFQKDSWQDLSEGFLARFSRILPQSSGIMERSCRFLKRSCKNFERSCMILQDLYEDLGRIMARS